MAKTHHAHLFGLRKNKYQWLLENDIATTDWDSLEPKSPHYLLIPQNTDLLKEYETGWKITEIMAVNTVGVVTGQDEKTIAYTKETAEQLAKSLGIPKDKIRSILYRPFDERFIVYDSKVVTRPRNEVMRHMFNNNLGFIFQRREEIELPNTHLLVTKYITEHVSLSIKTTNVFSPLYLYPDPKKPLGEKSIWPLGTDGRQPNLDKKFVEEFSKRLVMEFVPEGKFYHRDTESTEKKKYGPEDVFNYIYAVFHSPEYRKRYAEFLRIDFPRVPMISNKELFARLCGLGGELVQLHLLEDCALTRVSAPQMLEIKFPNKGENRVEKGFPKYSEGRVYINKDQYFEGVPKEVWEFFIGGYQVCDKWLKDRRGRTLSHDDLTHYQKVVIALSETIRIMSEIDKVIDSHGGWPKAFE